MNKYSHIGRNIRLHRRRAGLTIRELALRVGIREGPLGNIERGEHAPSVPVLWALARELRVSADALLAPEDAQGQTALRDLDPRPFLIEKPEETAMTPAAERLALDVIDALLALEDLSGAPKQARIPLATPLEFSEAGLEQLARTARGFFGIGEGVIFDYFELFESVGFRVVVAPIPRQAAKPVYSFTWFDPANHNAFFFLDAKGSPERQLFQLACGLGRVYVLTASLRRMEIRAPGDAPPLDAAHAARRFAAVFLMPEAAVRTTARQLGLHDGHWTWELLLRIKHRFGVSAETLLYRLEELRLLAGEANRALRAKLKEHYRDNGHIEPDSTRRVLTPNGRTWDLAITAERGADPEERVRAIGLLEKHGVIKV